jgi:hypothetical protein
VVTVPEVGLKLKIAAEQEEWIDTAQTSRRAASLVQSVAKAAVLRHGASGSWIGHFTGIILFCGWKPILENSLLRKR